MKYIIITGVLLFTGFAGEATASCSDPAATNLSTILPGSTVCAMKGNGDKWQEEHRAGGELWDYKMGPNHRIDPTKLVGSWSISDVPGSAPAAASIPNTVAQSNRSRRVVGQTTPPPVIAQVLPQQVCYNYGGGGTYCYTVHTTDNINYDFCTNGSLDVTATLVPNGGGCGF